MSEERNLPHLFAEAALEDRLTLLRLTTEAISAKMTTRTTSPHGFLLMHLLATQLASLLGVDSTRPTRHHPKWWRQLRLATLPNGVGTYSYSIESAGCSKRGIEFRSLPCMRPQTEDHDMLLFYYDFARPTKTKNEWLAQEVFSLWSPWLQRRDGRTRPDAFQVRDVIKWGRNKRLAHGPVLVDHRNHLATKFDRLDFVADLHPFLSKYLLLLINALAVEIVTKVGHVWKDEGCPPTPAVLLSVAFNPFLPRHTADGSRLMVVDTSTPGVSDSRFALIDHTAIGEPVDVRRYAFFTPWSIIAGKPRCRVKIENDLRAHPPTPWILTHGAELIVTFNDRRVPRKMFYPLASTPDRPDEPGGPNPPDGSEA